MFCISWTRTVLIAAAITVLATACGPLPRPFKPDEDDRAVSPLTELNDAAAVIVAPVAIDKTKNSTALAEHVVKELKRQNVPATTDNVLNFAYTLYGRAQTPVPTANAINIDWSLIDYNGTVVLHKATATPITLAAWQREDPAALAQIAQQSARMVATSLQAGSPAIAKQQTSTLGVIQVTGAPGDGNESLRTAFEAVLKRAGLPVASPPESATVHIFGEVVTKDRADAAQDLEIIWRLRTADGRDLGELTQRNVIDKDKISTHWGSLAYDITFAMVDSVAGMFTEIDRIESIRRQAEH